MKEIERIISESQEAIAEAGSETEKTQIKISAYEAIVGVYNRIQQLRAEHAAEVKALIDEERLLDERDGTIAGRAEQ